MGAVDGEEDGDTVGALVGTLVGVLLELAVGDPETTLDLERLRYSDLLLDFYLDLLLLPSLDLPLEALDLASSFYLLVFFFDAAVSEPFFLDLLLLLLLMSDFLLSDPCFLFLELLLLSDFGGFFFCEAMHFFVFGFLVCRERALFIGIRTARGLPFFEAAALDLLDLDFLRDSLDLRLRDLSSPAQNWNQ
jgi:hypothetical protein